MKKCPMCQMTVKADAVCPICQTTLTYEPEVAGHFEKKKLNKYLYLYLLKRFAFVIAAIIFCVVSGLFIQMDAYWLATAAIGAAALVVTAFQRTLTMYIKITFFETLVWVFIICVKYVAMLLPVIWGLLYLIFN